MEIFDKNFRSGFFEFLSKGIYSLFNLWLGLWNSLICMVRGAGFGSLAGREEQVELPELLGKEEGAELEFKPSLSDLDRIVEVAVSFANCHGGTVLVGVADDGKVKGIAVGKQTLEQLANKITDNTDPVVYPKVEVVEVGGKKAIEITVSESFNRPHTAFGRPFKRVGKVTKAMKRDEYERLLLGKSRHKMQFDSEVCEGAAYSEIDKKKVDWYLKQRESARNIPSKINIPVRRLLSNLEAIKNSKPTNAGILFFGKVPQAFLHNTGLRVVRFKGTKITNPTLDTFDCEGTLWEMMAQAEDSIRRNIRFLGTRTEKSFRREDKFEYPIKALREAIINALIHRNYFEPADVRVFIFDDRVEVISPGTFPEGVTPNKPRHKPVNKVLCSLFYDIGFIEKYGSGIAMMKDLSREWGNKEPYYELHPVETKIVFESPIKESTFVEIDDVVLGRLNERQTKAISYLKRHGKITRREYGRICKISARMANIDLKDLEEKRIIRRVGAGRSVRFELV